MNRLLILFFLATLVATAAPPCASGYVIDQDGAGHPLKWWPGDIPAGYRLVAGNVPGGNAGEVSLQRAAQSWSEVTPRFGWRFDGFDAAGRRELDGRNYFFWVYQNWPLDPMLVSTSLRSFRTEDGRLVDVDIIFNAESYQWSVGGVGYDVEAVAAHEMGHALGLGHSADRSATMYARMRPRDTQARSLEQDDRDGIMALYGAPTAANENPTAQHGSPVSGAGLAAGGGGGGGGCTVGSPAGGADIFLLLLLLALLTRRDSRARFP